MTEADAKEKWCPFARVLLPVHQSGNRISTFHTQHATGTDVEYYAQQERDCNCIASKCMAWRWAITPRQATRNETQGCALDNCVPRGYCGFVPAGIVGTQGGPRP